VFKKISIGLCCLVIILPLTFIFTGCGGPDYRYVRAYVAEGYYEKFDAQEFTLEDFQMENAAEFHYYCSFTDYDPITGEQTGSMENGQMVGQWFKDYRYFFIELKTQRRQQAIEAINYLATLEFVERAILHYPAGSPGKRQD
jgi:hypothetical protein